MDVEIFIEQEEKVGTNNSTKEEVKKDGGGAFEEMLEDEMDSLNEKEIWCWERTRIDKALEVVRDAERQDPAEVHAAARGLVPIIVSANVEQFIFKIESLANRIDPSAIFNSLSKAGGGSLLHVAVATCKDDILRLLLDYVPGHLIAAQNDRGDTPLHMAILVGRITATAMLIRRIMDLPNVEDKKRILRMQNKDGNTALQEAVHASNVNCVRHLSNEDLEPVYWKTTDQTSPLYLAFQSIHEVFLSLPLEPSRIQVSPPIHGAILILRLGKYLNLFIVSIYV
ncbi:hypothetical protein BT93_L0303 [Corymbia citriodora subsp. variegata]|uniref:Uncharacterized protein n=1 Tax=Corymbia citriodora subsp. variegata TaxID=360336 RepID=A0A8T0CSL6_CORYI|nr:hypothetical protein BT93_L0303 [Corymbia citriodora subsp. variegata]